MRNSGDNDVFDPFVAVNSLETMNLLDSNQQYAELSSSKATQLVLPEHLGISIEGCPDARIETVSMSDHHQIGMRIWESAADGPSALYLHGIEGHSQWFANTAKILQGKGISTFAPDRRGAGLNFFERGHVENYQCLLNDLEFFLDLISQARPGKPIFIIGNCWSAKMATIVAASDYKKASSHALPEIAGLILICPAIKTKPDLSFAAKLKIAIAVLTGKKALIEKFPIPLTTSMFTDSARFLKYIDNDPLRLTEASKAFYFASFILSKMSEKKASKLHLPVLLLQSELDSIVDVTKTKNWFNTISSNDKTFRLFENAAHSLDFDETHFADYAACMGDWIESHANQRGVSN